MAKGKDVSRITFHTSRVTFTTREAVTEKVVLNMKYLHCILIGLVCCCILFACHSDESKQTSKRNIPTERQRVVTEDASAVARANSADWPMFMRDVDFTGRSPDTVLQPPLSLRWKFKTGGPVLSGPVVSNGIVYVGSDDGKLYALKAQQWGEKWHYKTSVAMRYAPTVWNNTVYFSAADNTVYALDAQTGALIWKSHLDSWIASPVIVANGEVYVGVYDRKIYVFDARSGKQKTQLSFQVTIGNTLYICMQGNLRPLNPINATEQWRETVGYSMSSPVIANGVVYIGARDNKIHGLDENTRELLWEYETNGWVDAAPAISQGMLFVASHDGYVYAFGKASETTEVIEDIEKAGIVTRDEAKVYAEPDYAAKVLLLLNDGVELPVLRKIPNWYYVRLPNNQTGWMDYLSFAQFNGGPLIQFNADAIRDTHRLTLPEGAEYPQWSPNGRSIAFLRRLHLKGQYWKAEELWIMDIATTSSRKLCTSNFYNPYVSWSLDSKWLAFEAYESGSPYIWIIQRDGSDLTRLVRGDAPAWSPKAHQIAFRLWEDNIDSRIDSIWRINIDASGLRKLAEIPVEGYVKQFIYLNPVVWAPDGTRIAHGVDGQHYKTGDSRIVIFNANGKVMREILTHSDWVGQIRWSPDGKYLVYVLSGNPGKESGESKEKRLHLMNLDTKTVKVLKHTAPAWSPDGRRLLFMEEEDCMGLKWKVWILNLEDSTTLPIARANAPLKSLAWLPDGHTICLWSTSGYIQKKEYKPAQTIGWIVRITNYELRITNYEFKTE